MMSVIATPLSSSSTGTVLSRFRARNVGGELFAVAQINLHGRHSKTLLSKKNAHATRAGCRYAVVKFHEGLLVSSEQRLITGSSGGLLRRVNPVPKGAFEQQLSEGSF